MRWIAIALLGVSACVPGAVTPPGGSSSSATATGSGVASTSSSTGGSASGGSSASSTGSIGTTGATSSTASSASSSSGSGTSSSSGSSASSSSGSGTSSASTSGSSGGATSGNPLDLVITSALTLDRDSVWDGQSLRATIGYTNQGSTPIEVQVLVCTVRPPGGTHGGGPFDDLLPQVGPQSVAAGQTVAVDATRAFTASDAPGTWEAFCTWEDASGGWHDSPSVFFEAHVNVTAATRTLTWSDEFDAADGGLPDASRWTFEIGGGGWGNQEREYYTNSNAHEVNGELVIDARAAPAGLSCWYGPCEFTSSRLITQGHFTQRYGRFEALIRIPKGQGVWPAFWLLGDDIGSVGWPSCGEIDVMENIGREPATAYGTLHGPQSGAQNGWASGGAFAAAYDLGDGYHLYAVDWDASGVRFFVDETLYETRTPSDVPSGGTWTFDHPFFLLLNFAVGGSWPGTPDPAAFPQQMKVDYVRAYQ